MHLKHPRKKLKKSKIWPQLLPEHPAISFQNNRIVHLPRHKIPPKRLKTSQNDSPNIITTHHTSFPCISSTLQNFEKKNPKFSAPNPPSTRQPILTNPLNPRFETPTPPILAKKKLWDETKYVFQNHLTSSFNPRTPPHPEKSFKKLKKIQRNFAGNPYQIYSQISAPRRGDPYTFAKNAKFSKNEFFRNSPDFYWGQGNSV